MEALPLCQHNTLFEVFSLLHQSSRCLKHVSCPALLRTCGCRFTSLEVLSRAQRHSWSASSTHESELVECHEFHFRFAWCCTVFIAQSFAWLKPHLWFAFDTLSRLLLCLVSSPCHPCLPDTYATLTGVFATHAIEFRNLHLTHSL